MTSEQAVCSYEKGRRVAVKLPGGVVFGKFVARDGLGTSFSFHGYSQGGLAVKINCQTPTQFFNPALLYRLGWNIKSII